MDYPNGLALSPDEKSLFVAESYRNRIVVFELRAPGVAGPARVFCELPRHASGIATKNLPDGLTLDYQGRLWIAHYGMGAVHRLSREGVLELSIETGMPLTSNLLMTNPDTLIVTGGYGEPGPGAVLKIEWAETG